MPMMCAPAPGGSTCDAGSGPATLGGGNGGVDIGAGNPINLITGNKYQREVDMAPLPGVLGLEIVRHYNSAYSRRHSPSGILGRGWRLSYETFVHATARNLQVIQADGSRIVFERDPGRPDLCATTNPAHGTLAIENAASVPRYVWTWPDGRQLRFDAGGRLTQILAPTGEFASLQYAPDGTLIGVTDPQGRSLRLHYPARDAAGAGGQFAGVQHIDGPLGRVRYRYGSEEPNEDSGSARTGVANLVAVRLPGTRADAVERHYHYEDARHPTLLTGISVRGKGGDGVAMDTRIAHYAYDERGRAVRSIRGTPEAPIEDVRLRYLGRPGRKTPGVTELTNHRGEITTYTHRIIAGEYRLVEARGAGCASCAPANFRHRYDGAGRLLETSGLDAAGGVLRTMRLARDSSGRILRIEQLDRDEAGKPGPARLLRRFEYENAAARPTLIARPSVVPGAEHTIRFHYNEAGQPVRIDEAGFSPVDADGRPAAGLAQARRISRSVRLSYERLHGRSVLVAIDGPLPNGPSASPVDSDITRLGYDASASYVADIIHPMGLTEKFERDPAGRIVGRTPIDGVEVRAELDPQGLPTNWQRGEAVASFSRDARGRPTRIELPDGEIRFIGHDGPTGLAAMVSTRGRGWWLGSAGMFPMQQAIPTAGGRWPPTAVRAGPTTATQTLALAGRNPADTWPGLQRWFDDFGRLRAVHTDATGRETFDYDAAGRLVERRFADGWRWQWRRDAAGRVVAHAVGKPGQAPVTTKLDYKGAYLVRIAHPHEIETRRYDRLGRLSIRTIERPSPLQGATAALSYMDRFEYDDADRLVRHRLPEGGTLKYGWGIGSQLRTIDWVDDWQRTTPIIRPLPQHGASAPRFEVADTTRHPGSDWRGYRYGNGVEARWTIGPDGRLHTLQHRIAETLPPSPWTAWLRDARAAGPQPTEDTESIERWTYRYDTVGRMATKSDALRQVETSFAYDSLGRLVGVQAAGGPRPGAVEYYAWDALGNALGRYYKRRTSDFNAALLLRGAGGLPQRTGILALEYSADRRLSEVRRSAQGGQPAAAQDIVASYRHNSQGMRTDKTVFDADRNPASGARTTHFLWQGHRLVGEASDMRGQIRLKRRYVYALGVPIALIDYPDGRVLSEGAGIFERMIEPGWQRLRGRGAAIRYIHANEIGTPTAVTDNAQAVLWRARHAAFGEAEPISLRARAQDEDFTLNLRLPGQYFDAETGLHDNVLRTYDPARGQYLEPDPLGPHPLTQPYAYAGHDPLIHVDPLGLILFAFDGTGNDPFSNTNVWLFAQNYADLDEFDRLKDYDGTRFYSQGVGTMGGLSDNVITGGALAWQLRGRIDGQLKLLDDYVRERFAYYDEGAGAHEISPSMPLDFNLDVVGYSRGAAAARDFANQVVGRRNTGYYRDLVGGTCVAINLRFVGLFDTVLSTPVGSFDLRLPETVAYAAHAVARNEHRTRFPLESIEPDPRDPGWRSDRVERGFVGAHSDIGGGYNCTRAACDRIRGDLSDVALVWMVEQAIRAGVNMNALADELRTVSMPVLHAETNAGLFFDPSPNADRAVRYPGTADAPGFEVASRDSPLQGMSYDETLDFITFDRMSSNPPEYRGKVDIAAYAQWLRSNYGIELNH